VVRGTGVAVAPTRGVVVVSLAVVATVSGSLGHLGWAIEGADRKRKLLEAGDSEK